MPWGPACFPNTINHICLNHKPYKAILPPLIMFLHCCLQTPRKRLQKGKAHSGWEDLLHILVNSSHALRGEDFWSFRYWKSSLGILHIFCVALGKVLWPQFCTREGKGSVATGFYISYLVGNFPLRPHCFHFTGFESLTVLSPNRWPLLRGYPLKPCFSLWLQIIAVKQIIFKHHILHPP